jgi:hypothetical protein
MANKIIIPEPCHEGWHTMQPNENGRFCNSCEKTVVDFTQMNREEIQHFFVAKRGEKICGHFKISQVEVPTAVLPDRQPKPWLHRKLNAWYTGVENGISVQVFRVAFLACISFCMTLAGCKNEDRLQEEMSIEEQLEHGFIDGGVGPDSHEEEFLTGDTIYIPQDENRCATPHEALEQ